MNWDVLAAIAEFFGAIGVIVTLIYLATQIRLFTKATKDEATRSLMLANSEASMDVAKDGELTDIIQRGLYRHGELTPIEQTRYNLFFFSYYNQVDYAYERFREGQLDERSWNKIAKEIPAVHCCAGREDLVGVGQSSVFARIRCLRRKCAIEKASMSSDILPSVPSSKPELKVLPNE